MNNLSYYQYYSSLMWENDDYLIEICESSLDDDEYYAAFDILRKRGYFS